MRKFLKKNSASLAVKPNKPRPGLVNVYIVCCLDQNTYIVSNTSRDRDCRCEGLALQPGKENLEDKQVLVT